MRFVGTPVNLWGNCFVYICQLISHKCTISSSEIDNIAFEFVYVIYIKVAVNVSSSGKPVLRYMYYVNEPGLTLLMKKTP